MQKARFVWRVLQLLLKIGQVVAEAQMLVDVYTDRGYAAGGADPITAEDLQVSGEGIDLSGFTLTNFGEVAGVLTALIAFMDNKSTTAADRLAIYNKYRRDI